MKNIYFKHKKIGIWGFGIVGKSVYEYIQQFPCSIQILDKQPTDNPHWIAQNDQSIEQFLQHNDIIIASPGIPLHTYEQYLNKFITELDIYQQLSSSFTVAITGTIGKTSITNALAHCMPTSIAAGNIGYPMICALLQNPQPRKIVLELSSFQLHYAKNFAPDIAIWTNFYANHLDHHLNEDEYFNAKCKIFKHQTTQQTAIIPCNLINKIQSHITLQSKIFLTCKEQCLAHNYPTFKLHDNKISLTQQKNISSLLLLNNMQDLPLYTYKENWLVVIAALYLQNIPLSTITNRLQTIPSQEHRLEKIATYSGSTFYNDSKSTVWQSTKEAVQALQPESCALFLGGLSKGADRTPLIQYLQNKSITIFAFGKEATQIKNLCNQYHVSCLSFPNLETAVQSCFDQPLPKNILLSPAGSSFDLFKNYQERGNFFKQLIEAMIKIKQ